MPTLDERESGGEGAEPGFAGAGDAGAESVPVAVAGGVELNVATERLLHRDSALPSDPSLRIPCIEEEDEEPEEPGQSPFSVWFGLLARTLVSALHTAFSAVLFVLYPVYYIIPSFVLEGLFRGVFRIGYLVYLTPLGGWLHMRGLRPNQAPHSAPVPPSQLSTCVIHTVRPAAVGLTLPACTGRSLLTAPPRADPHHGQQLLLPHD